MNNLAPGCEITTVSLKILNQQGAWVRTVTADVERNLLTVEYPDGLVETSNLREASDNVTE